MAESVEATSSKAKPPKKYALVTTGATASFDSLVRAVLDPNFLKDLRMAGYTNLTVQHGKDKNNIVKEFNRQYPAGCNERHGVSVETFDFKRDGLFQDLMAAQGRDPDAVPGMVITHAGTGSIMETLRASVPMIVVPNPTLADNHQKELAEVLDQVGLVVHADVRELDKAILKVEARRGKRKPFPPLNEADESGQVERLERVLSELGVEPSKGVLDVKEEEEELLVKIYPNDCDQGVVVEGVPGYPY